MEDKIEHAQKLIEDAVRDYPRIAVASSFGKDSMVTLHLAREVDPGIEIFSVMTRYWHAPTKDTTTYVRVKHSLASGTGG